MTIAEVCADRQLDVEGVLAFTEYLIANVGRIWIEATLEQRQGIQAALFPEGIPFDGQTFGTAVTCLAFSALPTSKVGGIGWRPHGDPVACIRCAERLDAERPEAPTVSH
jgi:hypothetical protein